MKKNLYFILILAALGACKKTDPIAEEPITSLPVFNFNGDISETPTDITAGLEDYYMFSNYNHDTLNVFSFYGSFNKTTLDSNTQRLDIILRDNEIHNNQVDVDINTAILPGYYYYRKHANLSLQGKLVQFNSNDNNNNAKSFSWDFGDGFTSSEPHPVHFYSSPKKYPVSLTTYTNHCNIQMSIPVDINQMLGGCMADFSFTVDSNDYEARFQAITKPHNGLVFFNFGDGNFATIGGSNNYNIKHEYRNPGVYKVRFVLIDYSPTDTCISEISKFVTIGPAEQCNTDFSFKIIANDPLDLSTVQVNWYNEKGEKYSSLNVLQTPESYFEILAVENYYRNEKDLATKKIRARLSCKLKAENGNDIIFLNNAKVSFAIAYPD